MRFGRICQIIRETQNVTKMLKPLTSLRFFAAAGVVAYHLGLPIDTGGPGVMFFFILSGFIIAFNYAQKFEALDSSRIGRFYISRAARIFPMHLVCMLIAAPICAYESLSYTAGETIGTALLLNSWTPGTPWTYNFVAWTLSVELFFYAATPFILLALHRARISKNIALCLATALSVWAIAYFSKQGLYHLTKGKADNAWWWFFNISPYFHAAWYLIGSCLGLAFKQIKNRQPMGFLSATAIECAMIAVMIATYLWCVPHRHSLDLMAFSFAGTIFAFAFSRGALSWLLSHSFFVVLGEISFSVYMVHQILMRAFNENIMWVTHPAQPIDIQIIFGLLVIAVSYVAYHFIEDPARLAVKRLMDRRKRPTSSLPDDAAAA